ncbi:hypothetical protein MMC21_006140 [Puttea exsequens]|nr:hypothetical protein [Puttea exsequens]
MAVLRMERSRRGWSPLTSMIYRPKPEGEDVEKEIEKQGELKDGSDRANVADIVATPSPGSTPHDVPPIPALEARGKLASFNAKVESLVGLEARGIKRVQPNEQRHGGIQATVQMFALWFSINLSATNIVTGLLGPLLFGLGWKDSVYIVILANALASCAPAYTSTFGPLSGSRTMVRVQALPDRGCQIDLYARSSDVFIWAIGLRG